MGRHTWRGLIGLLVLPLVLSGLLAAPATAAAHVPDSPEESWRVDGRVYATVVVGNTVFVGGKFSQAVSPTGATAARKNLAAFRLDTGELLSWRADAGAPVRALVSDGTWLYVGGAFGRIGGQAHLRLGRVLVSSGAPDPGFAPSVNAPVRALDVEGSSVYVGGAFTEVNGQPRQYVAKVDAATGALDPEFAATAGYHVWGVAKNPTSDVLYLSGRFSQLNGASRNGVGAVSSTTGKTTSTVFASSARPTLGLETNEDGTRLFGAGGSGGNALAAWNTTTGVRVWRQVADGDIQAVDHHRGMVYFGFHDGYQGDTRYKFLAASADTGLVDPGFRPRFDSYWGVFAVHATDAGVVIGGEFTQVSGVPAQGWARFLPAGEPAPETTATRYLGPTSTWRYWDRGTRPTGWHTVGFDDSGWPTGTPQLGYGDGDEQTVLDRPDQAMTAYFRNTFQVPELPDTATVQIMADDGAVIYVNGQEIARDNMPAGTIDNDTRASTTRSGGEESALRPYPVPVSALEEGSNTIAVEVHQSYPSSSDLSFDLDLIGETTAEETSLVEDSDPVTTVVVEEGATWRWYFEQPAPPADWKQADFADGAWGSGPAPLGWGDPGPIATVIDHFDDPLDRARAAYFRHAVQIDDAGAVTALQLRTVADDGVVVYVNGVEVGRKNMPDGEITHMTYSTVTVNTRDANADPFVIDVPVSVLRDGTNVVAAETHVGYRRTRNLSFKLEASLTTQ